jgi:hypothetical protein
MDKVWVNFENRGDNLAETIEEIWGKARERMA